MRDYVHLYKNEQKGLCPGGILSHTHITYSVHCKETAAQKMVTHACICTAKSKLSIGSSVWEGIKIWGLHDIVVKTIRGVSIDTVTSEMMKNGLSYRNIILQVGGNDIAQHGNLEQLEGDYES